jgi:hypothetical protein
LKTYESIQISFGKLSFNKSNPLAKFRSYPVDNLSCDCLSVNGRWVGEFADEASQRRWHYAKQCRFKRSLSPTNQPPAR